MDLEDAGMRVKFVLHDRFASLTATFDEVFRAAGARRIRAAVRDGSPMAAVLQPYSSGDGRVRGKIRCPWSGRRRVGIFLVSCTHRGMVAFTGRSVVPGQGVGGWGSSWLERTRSAPDPRLTSRGRSANAMAAGTVPYRFHDQVLRCLNRHGFSQVPLRDEVAGRERPPSD
jgi:hypothetical protein